MASAPLCRLRASSNCMKNVWGLKNMPLAFAQVTALEFFQVVGMWFYPTVCWDLAILILSYARQVCMIEVTEDMIPKIKVSTKMTIASQNVYHCRGFRLSAHIWLHPTGGEWNMWWSSRSLFLQWSKSIRVRGPESLKGPSRWKVWSCWRMKLSVSGSQYGKSKSSESSVSLRTVIGINALDGSDSSTSII
jgi:hypothetical protein